MSRPVWIALFAAIVEEASDICLAAFRDLARTEGMTPEQFHEMVNTKSGLLGISETSSDVRDLLAREKEDVRAGEALAGILRAGNAGSNTAADHLPSEQDCRRG